MAANFDLLKLHGGVNGLAKAIATVPDLRSKVEAELAELKGINPERCIVTREYRDALLKALG